ncbi:hypothetical protein [Caulobacter sp. NIBR1757]|uniref:hypothetical protein n=1 Tax=Caulobacter sp. NIBR1757 TaxID=3016000 RepID=UPI0022F0D1D0|nr:hypothetical protein [Caulobacter sp. NIBR1757]WGM39124.1 hypothetical protein AMEJIAPC_02038 [Caulobacter sp. NIBR1757]
MFVLISALALLAADPAPATPVSPVDVTAPQRSSIPVGEIGVKDPDRLTCKREAVVGSRRKSKICDTKAGWQKRQDQAQQIMDGNRTTGDAKPR